MGLEYLGQDPMAQWANVFKKASVIKILRDPLSDEAEANQINKIFLRRNSREEQGLLISDLCQINERGGEQAIQIEEPVDKNAMTIIHSDDRSDIVEQGGRKKGNWGTKCRRGYSTEFNRIDREYGPRLSFISILVDQTTSS